jgi:hypothetical protein
MQRMTRADAAGRWKIALSAAVLVMAVGAVFGQVCTFDFTLWDDPQTVSQNPLLNPPSLPHAAALWQKPIESLYIPVTYSLWSAVASMAWLEQPDAHGYHLNPYLFHSLNLLLHLACVLVVWRLLWRLVQNPWATLAGALVFALHPLQVESVAWVSGAKDLLYALLSLLATMTFLEALRNHGMRRIALHATATLLFMLAFLAKPTAVVVPLLAVALAWGQRVSWRRGDLAMVAGWFALAAIGAAVTRLVQTGSNAGPTPHIWFRPLVALDALTFYLWKLVFPLRLAPDYGRSPSWLLESGWWRITWVLPVAVVVAMIALRAPHRIWLAVLVFAIPLVPVLGLATFNFQFYSTVADHYLYLAMLGVGLLVAQLLSQSQLTAWKVRAVIVAFFITLVTVWAAISFVQAGTWQNSRLLFEHTLAVNPSSFISHYDLGVLDEAENQSHKAVNELEAAIRVRSDYVPAHAELASLLLREGHVDQGLSEMVESLRLTAGQQPDADLTEAYVNVGLIAHRCGRPVLASRIAQEGLKRYPQNQTLRQLLMKESTTAPSSH